MLWLWFLFLTQITATTSIYINNNYNVQLNLILLMAMDKNNRNTTMAHQRGRGILASFSFSFSSSSSSGFNSSCSMWLTVFLSVSACVCAQHQNRHSGHVLFIWVQRLNAGHILCKHQCERRLWACDSFQCSMIFLGSHSSSLLLPGPLVGFLKRRLCSCLHERLKASVLDAALGFPMWYLKSTTPLTSFDCQVKTCPPPLHDQLLLPLFLRLSTLLLRKTSCC